MKNKSVAYMLVAVLIGVTLITAVPDQITRYANPSQMLSRESGDGESTTVNESEMVIQYWDSISNSDNESNVVTMTEKEFADSSVNSTGEGGDEIMDLANELGEMESQLENVSEEFADVESSIADVAALAADAVEAAEAAAEAVGAVASIANAPSGSGVDAAEAASDAKSAQKTLNMFMWYAFDALIAVGVYFLAKNRFG